MLLVVGAPRKRQWQTGSKWTSNCQGYTGTRLCAERKTPTHLHLHQLNTHTDHWYTSKHKVLLVAISNHIRQCPTAGNSGVLAGYKGTRFGVASRSCKLTKCQVHIPTKQKSSQRRALKHANPQNINGETGVRAVCKNSASLVGAKMWIRSKNA